MKAVMNKLRALYNKGALHIFAGQFLTKFISFFGSIFVVRVLTKADYGIFGYFENLYSYAFVFAGLGATNAMMRYIVLGKTDEEKNSYYRYILKRAILIDAVITALIFLINLLYVHPDEYSGSKVILYILSIGLPFHDVFHCNLSNERARYGYKSYAYYSVAQALCMIILRVVSAKYWGLIGLAVSQTVVYVVLALVSSRSNIHKYYKGLHCESLDLKTKREVNRYSFQYMLTNGLWALFMLNDVFLMGKLGISAEALAEYKVAYVLPANLSIISVAIGTFVATFFIENENDRSWVVKHFKLTISTSSIIIGCAAVVLGVFARPIIVFIYGVDYAGTAALMRILLISAFMNSAIRNTTANILSAMGKIKINIIAGIVGVSIQIIGNIVLIPIYDVYATAIVAIVSQGAMACILLTLFIRSYVKSSNEN